MKKLCTYLVLIFVSSSFITKKELIENQYIKEIPFNFDYGVPIIKATINNKEYNFLFDTGMPTVLSESISNDLNLKSIRSIMGMDINGNTKQESHVIVNEISIGEIGFKQIEALSTDLSTGFEIGCLNLDGVIGNNLIKNAIWEIDYENKVIRLTDNIDNFKIPENAAIIKFKTNKKKGYYSPSIDVTVNKKKRKGVKFDTGSNGGIKLPLNFYSSVLDDNKSVEYYGKASAAIYGKGENKNYVDSKVNSIEIGGLHLQNKIVTFNENSPTVGNQFLKNFKIIISYDENKIYMITQKESISTILENFGFQTSVNGQKAIIAIIYKNSNAEKKGLQLGDEIVTVNDFNFRELISKDACDFFLNNPIKEMDLININYSRNGDVQSLQLEKETLID
ncbi:aspartyl protease family protein [Cellulophaga sp. HaHaR_3_176]|uniref:aspartyl protease family protein n=1 Tax=Cellulophaga sp. HaHaR_3_176 TaxID=1942464 RepID=UPI001C1F90E9|nr:aspartyl protease family protein [Cellulophaga sp. HaHaR_3_176]QWX84855.1 aspartyl protease family protein [Cellulophaga sp. HaHaR_3_176]